MSTIFVPECNAREGFTTVSHVNLPQTAPAAHVPGPFKSFLKGEPKALGTVQILIGVITILFGICSAATLPTFIIYSGAFAWGPLIYITAGSLSVAAENNLNSCLVKASLTMNIISAVAAGIVIILLPIDIVHLPEFIQRSKHGNGFDHKAMEFHAGVTAILLILSVLEMIISICISGFSCKVTCCTTTKTVYDSPGTLPLSAVN